MLQDSSIIVRIKGVKVGTFYDKRDISDAGKIRMAGLTESIAVVAIDKHGNESKVYKVEGGRLKAEGNRS